MSYQDFAYDEWHKKHDELFADPTDILDVDEPTLELNSIFHKGFETNLYFEESCSSSSFSDIPDLVEDEEKKNNNDTSEDQLNRETENSLPLQLNGKD